VKQQLKTRNAEKQKKPEKELVMALMHQSKSHQPTCETCGNHFKPEEEELEVETPKELVLLFGLIEVPPHETTTDFVKKPDYCSPKCEAAKHL
jgi:DNA repair exonuclease SbcCD ATPase subunit